MPDFDHAAAIKNAYANHKSASTLDFLNSSDEQEAHKAPIKIADNTEKEKQHKADLAAMKREERMYALHRRNEAKHKK